MKAKEIRQLTAGEMNSRISELRIELVKIRNQISRGTTLKIPSKARTIRRTIAKMLTIINEKITGEKESGMKMQSDNNEHIHDRKDTATKSADVKIMVKNPHPNTIPNPKANAKQLNQKTGRSVSE